MTSALPSKNTPHARAREAPFGPTVAVLSGTALLATGQLYGVIPLLGRMAHDWHTKPTALTWLVTAFGLGYAAGFLLFGPLSDRYGRRRIIVGGVAATALTSLLVITATGTAPAIALRVLQGLTIGAFPPAAFAYVGERLPVRRRLVTVTAMTTGFLSSAVVGQLAAQWSASALGWRPFFLGSAALFAVAALALHRVLLPGSQATTTSPLAAYRAMPGLLRSPSLRMLYVATPVVLASFVAIFTGLQLNGVQGLLGLRASALPVILAIPFLTGRLARVPGVLRAAGALVLAALSTGLIGLLHPGTLGLAVLLMGVTAGVAVAAPGLIDTIGSRAGAARGPAVSVFTALLFLGASLGPQLASALHGQGLTGLSLVLATLLLMGAVFTVAARDRTGN